MKICKCFFYVLFSLSCLLHSNLPLLQTEDVHYVMNQLLDAHISENVVSQKIIKRSFKQYINNFDIKKTYLLKGEIEKYFNMPSELLGQFLEDYESEDLSFYLHLHKLLQKSINRARKLREEILLNKESLFAVIEQDKVITSGKLDFALNEQELKKRIRADMLEFIVIQKEIVGNLTKDKKQRIIALYSKKIEEFENRYLFVDSKGNDLSEDEKQDFFILNVLKSLARSLDSHTEFFSPSEAYDMKVMLEKGFFGLGIVLEEGIDGITITRLIEGGPAMESGLVQENDTIIEIDGVSVTGYSFQELLDLIKGQDGSSLQLGLKRKINFEEEQCIYVKLERSKVTLTEDRVNIDYEIVENGIIGKITLNSFYENSDGISSENDVRDALLQLKQIGNLQGLILDLRENLGGFLQQAVKVAGLFITNGVVVMSQYSSGEKSYYRDIDSRSYFEGPIVVLTSKKSASAAEIVAQALQDYGVGIVIGDEQTYGKGSIQYQTVTNGDAPSFFKVTVGRYYTVSGRSTQLGGVKADIIVPGVYSKMAIGEKLLEYPLSNDTMHDSYNDTLPDVNSFIRAWFNRNYIPTLQKKEKKLEFILPILKEKSLKRLSMDAEYQEFIRNIQTEQLQKSIEHMPFYKIDLFEKGNKLQVNEAFNIVKDILLLEDKQDVTK